MKGENNDLDEELEAMMRAHNKKVRQWHLCFAKTLTAMCCVIENIKI